MFFVHGNLINEMIKIEEQILDTMQSILNLGPDDDKEIESTLYDYLKMFFKREKRVFSKVPKDDSFISFVASNLNGMVVDNVTNPDNAGKIISRISSFLSTISCDIQPEEEYSTVLVGDKIIQYDLKKEHDLKRISTDYNKNLMVRYLKDLEELKKIGIYDLNEIKGIQFLNLFYYSDLCFELSDNDFDITKLSSVSDSDFMVNHNLSEEDFLDIKQNTIFSNLSVLIRIMLNDKNTELDHLDAEYNMKYLLSELSFDDLIELSEKLNSEFESVVQNGDEKQIKIVSTIFSFIEVELERKKVLDEKSIDYENMSSEDHSKLINLINFEKKFLSVFDDIDFDSNEVNLLNKMQELEDDFISDIDFDKISVGDFAIFISQELPNMLEDRELFVIQSRLRYLFPEYYSLFISPSQSNLSHELIFRNYIVDTLRDYYDSCLSLDDKLKDSFMNLYKDHFYIYPFLTRELISFSGNHLMIDSVSDELVMEIANIDDIEYGYDMNEQLYNEACSIINQFSSYDSSSFTSAFFQHKLLQFDYIVHILNVYKLEELYEFVNETDIEFKELLKSIIKFNTLDEDYSFEFSYSDAGVKIKVKGLN